jgi:hypothetical protein
MRLDQVILRGTRAAQPVATTLPNGALYEVSDEDLIEYVVSGAWALWATLGGGGGAPGGSDKNVQYNNSGAFGGIANNATATQKFLRQANSATPSFEAIDGSNLVSGSVGPTELAATAVTAGTYGDANNVGQFTVDADGRITGASEVAIAGGGGALWQLNLPQLAKDIGLTGLANGDYTVGLSFRPIRSGLQVSGIRFRWPGGAGALTCKAKLYTSDSFTTYQTQSTLVEAITGIAVNADAVIEVNFAAPLTLNTNKWYAATLWETSGAKFIQYDAPGSYDLPGPPTVDPAGLIYYHDVYGIGDAGPSQGSGNSYRAIIPVVSA